MSRWEWLNIGSVKNIKQEQWNYCNTRAYRFTFYRRKYNYDRCNGDSKENSKKNNRKKADYVLALKGNHGVFKEEVKDYFEDAIENKFKEIKCSKKVTLEKGYGRIEKREDNSWNFLLYFKFNIPGTGEYDLFAKAVRNHWGVESCHWILDVVFRLDEEFLDKIVFGIK